MRMRTRVSAAVVATSALWCGVAFGQAAPGQAGTPQSVAGEVVKIDRAAGKVAIRGADGKILEFQASPETLQDLKEGDRIEARLRPAR